MFTRDETYFDLKTILYETHVSRLRLDCIFYESHDSSTSRDKARRRVAAVRGVIGVMKNRFSPKIPGTVLNSLTTEVVILFFGASPRG